MSVTPAGGSGRDAQKEAHSRAVASGPHSDSVAVISLAVLGIVQEVWLARGARITSLVIYLLMGWLALMAVSPLWHALGPIGFAGLLAGGACYTGGVLFYVNDEKWRHGHGVWHLFVLAGSLCHFLTIWLFVA